MYLFEYLYIYKYFHADSVLTRLESFPALQNIDAIEIPTPGKLVLDMFKFGAPLPWAGGEMFQGLQCLPIPPIIMVHWKNGCISNVFFLSFRVMFH